MSARDSLCETLRQNLSALADSATRGATGSAKGMAEEMQIINSAYSEATSAVGATEEVLAAARVVVSRWREIKRADDEIALLDVALARLERAE